MSVTKPINEYAVWLYLRDHHCAFLRQRKDARICTNEYTVDGTHSYVFCPLMAEEYITVKLEDTEVVAFKKNPRVRIPSQMWEKIELPQTKEEGMQEVKAHVEHMALHSALKEAVLRKGEQLFEIAGELKRAPPPEEEFLEEEEELIDFEDLEDLDEDLLDEDLEDLDEDLLDEDLEDLE